MSLEKLGLLFLLNYFNQLGTVRNHMQLALRELLLAMQASVEITLDSANKTVLGNKMEAFSPLTQQLMSLIQFSIDKVTPSDGLPDPMVDEGHKLKEHIVNSIISAIDDEIENTKGTMNEKNKLKIEALYTVKQVLLNQQQGSVPLAKKKDLRKSRVA